MCTATLCLVVCLLVFFFFQKKSSNQTTVASSFLASFLTLELSKLRKKRLIKMSVIVQIQTYLCHSYIR